MFFYYYRFIVDKYQATTERQKCDPNSKQWLKKKITQILIHEKKINFGSAWKNKFYPEIGLKKKFDSKLTKTKISQSSPLVHSNKGTSFNVGTILHFSKELKC